MGDRTGLKPDSPAGPSQRLTIVMYHYVRDLAHSRYPEIKGLTVERFRQQLDYISKYYNVVRMEDVIEAMWAGKRLPARPLLLTFDDAYLDHFTNVFPLLDRFGWQGSFFPPAKTVLEGKVLDVNKIHFILASTRDRAAILAEIFRHMDSARAEYPLDDNESYCKRLAKATRLDSADVICIKRLLQRDLPEALRAKITDALFGKFVGVDEAAFSKELYMSLEQIKCMRRKGMFIGSHGHGHYFLNSVPPAEQRREIDLSLQFLKDVHADTENWAICYPYGAWNESLLTILRECRCKVGLTTEVELADLGGNPLTLPRLDTNDLPCEQPAPPNEWTKKILTEAQANGIRG